MSTTITESPKEDAALPAKPVTQVTAPSNPHQYVAVKKGKYVKSCIFVSWNDAKEHLLNYEGAEYQTFSRVEDAIQYISQVSVSHHVNVHVEGQLGQDDGGHNDNDILPLLALKTYRQNFSAVEEAEDVMMSNCSSSSVSASLHAQLPVNVTKGLAMNLEEFEGDDEKDDTTLEHFPRETETVEVDGRTVYKRRPSKNWMSMYKRLQEYRKKTGSFYINATDKDNITLKRWISEQKHQYKCFKTGKKHFTSQMKIQLLADIGFDFEFHSFDARLEQLQRYKEEHGTVDVPFDDPFLGKWMETQRRQLTLFKKGKESKLDEDKVQKLRDIGIDIEKIVKPNIRPRQETNEMVQKWDVTFQNLVEYCNKYGHCQVLRSDMENQELYKWVCVQRLEYKKLKNNQGTKMTASRLQKLNDIGFIFNPRPAYMKWEDRMDQLLIFKEKHGHLRVPVTDPDIGEFVARQRVEYAKLMSGKPSGMTQDRAEALSVLGFVFQVGKRRTTEMKTVRKTWEERYQELMHFKDLHGHTLVPQSNSTLGEWVHKQRKNYKLLKNGKACPLTTERALKLADIGFIFDASGYRRGRKEPVITQMSNVHVPPVPDPYHQQDIIDMENL